MEILHDHKIMGNPRPLNLTGHGLFFKKNWRTLVHFVEPLVPLSGLLVMSVRIYVYPLIFSSIGGAMGIDSGPKNHYNPSSDFSGRDDFNGRTIIQDLCIFSLYSLFIFLSPSYFFIYYRPKRSFGQGNIFTPVCHSVHRGGVWQGDPPGWMEEPPQLDGEPPPAGWRNPPGWMEEPPPGSGLQHTVYDRPVRILLECILVFRENLTNSSFRTSFVQPVETFNMHHSYMLYLCVNQYHWLDCVNSKAKTALKFLDL